MLCQKQIDNFFDTSYGNKEIFFIKLRVQGLHKNPVKTASAKSDETIFLKYQVYRKEQLYMRKKVLKADTVVKNYWRNNEQFADIFNAVLFNGNKVIKPEELEDMDTEESLVLEHKEYIQSIVAARDNVKIRKKSTTYDAEFVILGLEGQECIHYAMPLRVMGYDYSTYKKQYDDNAAKRKKEKGLTEDEYLSGMKKTDKFIPVITIVIYYGEKPWDGAVSLHGMLNIPKAMETFVNDYKIHLVEAGKNNLVLHNVNNQDLFNLLEILLSRSGRTDGKKEKAIDYTRKYKVDKAVIMTVAGTMNGKIDYNELIGEGEKGMVSVFQETWNEGEAKGIIEMGNDFGLSEEDILARLQKKLNVSLQKAQEYLYAYRKQNA